MKLLAQIPHFDRSETEVKVLGTGTEFAVSADAILHTDFSPSGSLVTVVEASEVGITAYDADLESGVLTNLATLDVGTTTPVVTRSITEPVLLIGGDAVVAVRLDDGMQTVLDLQELPEDLAGPTTRAPFVWSPSRQAVATMACSSETCVVDLIRVSDLSVSRMEEPFILHALTDSFALGYPSLSDRRWHVIDLSTGQRTPVAPQIAAAYDGFARDDGRFVAYGSSSWEPEVDPVDRPVVVIEPDSGATQLLFDQGPADWRYLYTGWTSTDWILLEEREGPGRTIVDQNDGSAVTFVLDDAGQPIAP
jgi:hypothetical protein